MMPVTIMTGGNVRAPESNGLTVESLPVTFQSILMTGSAFMINSESKLGALRGIDFMRSMTINARGTVFASGGEQSAVNTLCVLFLNQDVALPACFGDLVFADSGFWRLIG